MLQEMHKLGRSSSKGVIDTHGAEGAEKWIVEERAKLAFAPNAALLNPDGSRETPDYTFGV